MSQSTNNSGPLANSSVLIDQRPLLVENLAVESILPGLKQFLSFDEVDSINAAAERGNKVAALIRCLERRTSLNSMDAFNAFVLILGGIQPKLFSSLVGRLPAASEVDYCVTEFSQSLKGEIKKKGHKRDSALDDEIDFDSQFVELEIVKTTPDTDKLCSSSHDGQLPHVYQHHLSEVVQKQRSISACSVFDENDPKSQMILMSGRAGIGKTTTLQWLARQWALGKWATGFTVLTLLQLRALTLTNTQMTVVELLTLYGLFHVAGAINFMYSMHGYRMLQQGSLFS